MADVFISYRNTPARRALVRRLATALRAHDLSVWWDRGLETGQDYQQEIRRELASARVIVPLWCSESVTSQWVLVEARTGLQRGVLLPAMLQHVEPPGEYSTIQAHDLVGWNGAIGSPQLLAFVGAISSKLGKIAAAPIDLLEDLQSLPTIGALEATREVVDGESFTVYSNYELFGNANHAQAIATSSDSIDVMGISLMSFHRESDQPLGESIRERAAAGRPVRALMMDTANWNGLEQIVQNAEELVPRISADIAQSFETWRELSRTYPNVQCRRLEYAIVRQIATITPEKAVMTPYWYSAAGSRERPTFVCKHNSVLYKLLRGEFDALWAIGTV